MTQTPAAGKPSAVQRSAMGGEPGGASRGVAAPGASSAGDGGQRAGSWSMDGGAMSALGLGADYSQALQRRGGGGGDGGAAPGGEARTHAAAQRGIAGGGGELPYAAQIQHSFGSHDISDVRSHSGGAAGAACAEIGATAYATGRDVAFGGSPDLHTAAHEAAHVVQQRGGVQLKGGVGESGDHYERHADAVADLVVQGKSAQSMLDTMATGSGTHSAVQRFGSQEHKSLGDNATGGAQYDLGGHNPAIDTSEYNRAFHLTHGDIILLCGDFFSPRDTRPTAGGGTEPDPDALFLLSAIPSMAPGRNVGTWDEVVYALQKAIPADPRFAAVSREGEAAPHPWSLVTFSNEVKAAVDARYLRRAARNDEHFVDPLGNGGGPATGDGASAGGSYRALHEVAIGKAYDEGSAATANAREAAAHHYLTDHFAAGHLRTQRGSIRAHWQAIYPNFWLNIRNKIALDVAIWINANDAIGNLGTVDQIYLQIQTQVTEQTASIPPMGFDDLISLVSHDLDNEQGLWVTNDAGDQWKLFGDGHLDEPVPENRTREISQEAVTLGLADVEVAAAHGVNKTTPPMTRAQLFDYVRSVTGGRAQPSPDKYGPEQLLPRLDEARAEDNGTQGWQQANLEELWAAAVHSGTAAGGATYGSEISASMQGGELHHEIGAMAEKFPESQDIDKGVTFTVHPRRGFQEGFLAPMVANPQQGLRDVIHFSPARGQAGFNEDDAIMREVNGGEGAAAASEAELLGMTLEQRVDRVRVLISGYCGEDEGAVVVRLFTTAPAGDRRTIYQRIEGHAWEGQFRSGVFTIDDDLVDALTSGQLAELTTLLGS